jgi:hypothetical protein
MIVQKKIEAFEVMVAENDYGFVMIGGALDHQQKVDSVGVPLIPNEDDTRRSIRPLDYIVCALVVVSSSFTTTPPHHHTTMHHHHTMLHPRIIHAPTPHSTLQPLHTHPPPSHSTPPFTSSIFTSPLSSPHFNSIFLLLSSGLHGGSSANLQGAAGGLQIPQPCLYNLVFHVMACHLLPNSDHLPCPLYSQ